MKQYTDLHTNTPAQFHATIVRDLKMWQDIVKEAGITVE